MMDSASLDVPPKSIIVIGAGVFGLSTAYALLTSPRYDHTTITVLDQWAPPSADTDGSNLGSDVIPSSIDNTRIIRPDYASLPYALLASRAQHEWRAGWPHTLPTGLLCQSRLPLNPACEAVQQDIVYRESGLLLTCSESGEGLNPKGSWYVDSSLRNVLKIENQDGIVEGRVEVLKTNEEIARVLGTGGHMGDRGYVNWASGWADAGAAMALLRNRTKEMVAHRNMTGKAAGKFLEGKTVEVDSIIFERFRSNDGVGAVGVRLASAEIIKADLTIVAAGAWSPKLLPHSLNNRIKATGQAIGYVLLTVQEAKRFLTMPVPLNLSSGLFTFPPVPLADGSNRYIMKVARHGWGYTHIEKVVNSEDHKPSPETNIEVHVPAPFSGNRIGEEASVVMKQFLQQLGVPVHEWNMTRTCWYADTATANFIVDYIPEYGKSLFVASGGSGHGFKFVPVLGPWVVRAIESKLGTDQGRDNANHADAGLGKLLKDSWRWRSAEETKTAWIEERDGSRGGPRGMIWAREIEKGEVTGRSSRMCT